MICPRVNSWKVSEPRTKSCLLSKHSLHAYYRLGNTPKLDAVGLLCNVRVLRMSFFQLYLGIIDK